VVDDASNDDSVRTIGQWMEAANDPRFRLIRHEASRGQLASIATALAASESEFVAMLDADDFWFPNFLRRHIEVHLNSAVLASMSCSDLVQVDDKGRLLSGTCRWRNLAAKPRNKPWVTLRRAVVPRIGSAAGEWEPTRTCAVKYFPPGLEGYSAVTSGMMFRRAMLALALPDQPRASRIGADLYLNTLCQSLTGSFFLEDALGAYRRHGLNNFAQQPVIGTWALFAPAGKWAFAQEIYQMMLQHLLDRFDDLAAVFMPARVRTLIRFVFRELLSAGERVDDPRISARLGIGRVWRDRVRLRLRRIRRRRR
jgi:hypothetical protein